MQDHQAMTPPNTVVKAQARLTLSPIHSLESAPVQPIQRPLTNKSSGATTSAGPPTAATEQPIQRLMANEPSSTTTSAGPPTTATTAETTESSPKAASTGGILGSVFGWNKRKVSTGSQIAEDEIRQEAAATSRPSTSDAKRALQEVPENAITRNMKQSDVKSSPVVDRGVQTLSFSDLLDSVSRRLADLGAVSPGLTESGNGKAPEQYY